MSRVPSGGCRFADRPAAEHLDRRRRHSPQFHVRQEGEKGGSHARDEGHHGRGPRAAFPRRGCQRLTHLADSTHLLGMEAVTRLAERDQTGVIASASAGDEVAFKQIIAAHHDDMRRVCRYVTRDDAITEEAVQAAWSIAWRKLGSVRESDRLKPWLISIAVNEAKQLLRKRRRRSQIEVATDASARPGGVDPGAAVDAIDLRSAIERLSVDDQALLAMRYVVGFDSTELSAAIGISPAGTRTRLKRLLDRLRQELADG